MAVPTLAPQDPNKITPSVRIMFLTAAWGCEITYTEQKANIEGPNESAGQMKVRAK
jgi:hypothetical protein